MLVNERILAGTCAARSIGTIPDAAVGARTHRVFLMLVNVLRGIPADHTEPNGFLECRSGTAETLCDFFLADNCADEGADQGNRGFNNSCRLDCKPPR